MKQYITWLLSLLVAATYFTGCNVDDSSKSHMYKNMVAETILIDSTYSKIISINGDLENIYTFKLKNCDWLYVYSSNTMVHSPTCKNVEHYKHDTLIVSPQLTSTPLF